MNKSLHLITINLSQMYKSLIALLIILNLSKGYSQNTTKPDSNKGYEFELYRLEKEIEKLDLKVSSVAELQKEKEQHLSFFSQNLNLIVAVILMFLAAFTIVISILGVYGYRLVNKTKSLIGKAVSEKQELEELKNEYSKRLKAAQEVIELVKDMSENELNTSKLISKIIDSQEFKDFISKTTESQEISESIKSFVQHQINNSSSDTIVKSFEMNEEIASNYYKRALENYNDKDWLSAVENFENCLLYHPTNSKAHYFKGYCEVQLNRIQHAIISFQIAHDLDQVYCLPVYGLVYCYEKQGNREKVEEFDRIGISLNCAGGENPFKQ